MSNQAVRRLALLLLGVLSYYFAPAICLAAASGIGAVANTATQNLNALAKLITAGSYVAGMGFGVASLVKFKAHKDNPTQVHISQPIALLFVAAALLFIPSVFTSTGKTLFSGATQAGISGFASF
jgi:intracellular multiplication protein IcmD